jgi:hypothetical protein
VTEKRGEDIEPLFTHRAARLKLQAHDQARVRLSSQGFLVLCVPFRG